MGVCEKLKVDVLLGVRLCNMRGLLYEAAPEEDDEMSVLVRRGLVSYVPPTPTSVGGYVSVPFEDFAAMIGAGAGD